MELPSQCSPRFPTLPLLGRCQPQILLGLVAPESFAPFRFSPTHPCFAINFPFLSSILLQENEKAKDDIGKLRDAIDNSTFASPLMQLQQRTWLLHWSLYVFWNHENGRTDLIDLFFSPPYLAAIQVGAQRVGM